MTVPCALLTYIVRDYNLEFDRLKISVIEKDDRLGGIGNSAARGPSDKNCTFVEKPENLVYD
jgi:hypothetical protein